MVECVHVQTWKCTYVKMYANMYIMCIRMSTYAQTCISVYEHTYVNTCWKHTGMCVHVRLCMWEHRYEPLHIYAHACIHL